MKIEAEGRHSGQYPGSSTVIPLLSKDERVVIGYARRTGITPPMYPNHPVYQFETGFRAEANLPAGHFVFDGQEFHESKAWRSAHPPLLITACSKKKLPDPGRIPARQRYDGPVYRVIRRAQKEGKWPSDLIWLILSAEYGLITPETPLPDYDRRMTPARAAELRPGVAAALAPYLETERIILTHLGQDYRKALPAEIPSPNLYHATGRPGERLAQMKHWIHGLFAMTSQQ